MHTGTSRPLFPESIKSLCTQAQVHCSLYSKENRLASKHKQTDIIAFNSLKSHCTHAQRNDHCQSQRCSVILHAGTSKSLLLESRAYSHSLRRHYAITMTGRMSAKQYCMQVQTRFFPEMKVAKPHCTQAQSSRDHEKLCCTQIHGCSLNEIRSEFTHHGGCAAPRAAMIRSSRLPVVTSDVVMKQRHHARCLSAQEPVTQYPLSILVQFKPIRMRHGNF